MMWLWSFIGKDQCNNVRRAAECAAAGSWRGAAAPGDDPISKLSTPSDFNFKPKPGNFMVSFDLRDQDLPGLVDAISKATGKRFIFGAKLRTINATIVSPGMVTMDEAYAAFLSVLEQNGMTVIAVSLVL